MDHYRAEDRRFATAKIYTTVVEKLSEKVAAKREETGSGRRKERDAGRKACLAAQGR